jgi:nucleoside 2-deoxyribosyltransferase
MRVYIASDIKYARRWIALREQLFPRVVIVSTWIDFLKDGEPKASAQVVKESWENNVKDVLLCDVLILYVEPGDSTRGSCFEAGIAFAAGKRVVFVGDLPTIGSVVCCFEKFGSMEHVLQFLAEEEMMDSHFAGATH